MHQKPRLSVFTPTHKNTYLVELHESLQRQTYGNYEWVIVPNNGCRVPMSIQGDPRVVIKTAPYELRGIGALKKFACDLCSGEYLVEVDHDDLLHETALQRIADVAAATRAGFIYSDNVNFYTNGASQVFSSYYGWQNYPVEWRGRKYTCMRAFEPSFASLRSIKYAPNHVRVWSREAYDKVGGHDPQLTICDDHDLMCRTYLAGFPFAHINECLYFYRLQPHDQNSYQLHADTLHEIQPGLTDKYAMPIAREWCRRNNLTMLDMGAGINPTPGFTTVDVCDADILCDVSFEPLPLDDNSVGLIRASDFVEHIPRCNRKCISGHHQGCIVAMMNDFYRVLAPGGLLHIHVPSTDGRGAWQDPSHVSGWNSNSFWYYTKREQAQFIRGLECRFQLTSVRNGFPNDYHKQHNIVYTTADLVAIKGQPLPGIEEI